MNQRIQELENRYVRLQKRVNYPECNVIYIITNKHIKPENIYIIGKAINLKERLSVYNKSEDFEVIYYKSCKTRENMDLIERNVLCTLSIYREQVNRDRFVLPDDKDITFFTDVVDKFIECFEVVN